MKYLLIAALVTVCGGLFAGEEDSAVSKELRELRHLIQQQNEKIKALELELESVEPAGFAQVKDDAIVSLGNSSKNLSIHGDYRIRYEQLDLANNDPNGSAPNPDRGVDRNRRIRHRFRLGMTWKSDQHWTVTAGLATGDSDPRGTNQTWNGFETGDLRLDYAYATHTWGETTLILGQQYNPFICTDILFSCDIRPTGFVLKQGFGPGFLTVGALNVLTPGSNEALGWMFGVQGGVKLESDAVSSTLALGYIVYNDPFIDDLGLDDANNELSKEDYRFEILNLYADLSLKLGDNASLKFFAEYSENLGAPDAEDIIDAGITGSLGSQAGNSIDPADNNDAFILGAAVNVDRFSFSFQFISIEADAVPSVLTDPDFGAGTGTTDIEGYRLTAGVSLTKNCSLSLAYMTYERQDEYSFDLHGVSAGEGELYQLDLNYKF